MPLDEIVTLLRWIAAILTLLALFVLRTARAADSGADVRAVLAPIDRRFAGGWRSRPVLVHH